MANIIFNPALPKSNVLPIGCLGRVMMGVIRMINGATSPFQITIHVSLCYSGHTNQLVTQGAAADGVHIKRCQQLPPAHP
jgi:hypothetical protein